MRFALDMGGRPAGIRVRIRVAMTKEKRCRSWRVLERTHFCTRRTWVA